MGRRHWKSRGTAIGGKRCAKDFEVDSAWSAQESVQDEGFLALLRAILESFLRMLVVFWLSVEGLWYRQLDYVMMVGQGGVGLH